MGSEMCIRDSVPYSVSTKFPTQIGIFSPLKGLVANRPVKNPSFSIVARSSVFTDAWRIAQTVEAIVCSSRERRWVKTAEM